MWFSKKKTADKKVLCDCTEYLCEHGVLRVSSYPCVRVPTRHRTDSPGLLSRCSFCNLYEAKLSREAIVNCVGERDPLAVGVLDTGIQIEVRKEYRGVNRILPLFLKKLIKEVCWETIDIFGETLLTTEKASYSGINIASVTPIVGLYRYDDQLLRHAAMHVSYYSQSDKLYIQRSQHEDFDKRYCNLIALEFPFSLDDDTLLYVCHKVVEFNSEILPSYVHSTTTMLSLDSVVEDRIKELEKVEDRKEKFKRLVA